MAAETQTHHEVDQSNPWEGGKAPMKASYGKLMMWYFLLSDAFTFAGFLIAYGALRFSMPSWPVPDFVFRLFPFAGDTVLPLIFVTFMTFVLLFSSYTMVRAVQEGHRENKNGVVFWMVLTIIGGLGFLGCQAWEWTTLIGKENMTLTMNPFGSHTETGVYLGEDGKPGDEVFNPGSSYLMHAISVHSSEGHSEVGHDSHDVSGHDTGHQEEAGHGGGHGAHFAAPGDYPNAFVDDKGYIHRKYQVTEGDEAGKVKYEAFGPRAFGGLFFFITGFHGFHVFSGVVFLIIILVNVISGLYVARKNGYEMVEKIGLYWHFVDLVWVFVFLVFYLI